jgi:iron complex outermembrane receptor protein
MTHTSAPTPVRVLRTLAALCALVFISLSFAAEPPKQSFDLPAGDAESTLKLFTQQSGEQILYPPSRVSGVTTNAVKGEMTSADALDLMLANTALIAVRDSKTRAFTIQKALSVEDAEKNVARAIASSDRPERDRREAQYETDAQGNKVLKLDTFEVFGHKTLNMDLPHSIDDARPYVIYSHEMIDASGATSVEEFLRKKLTSSSTYRTNDTAQGIFSPGSTVSLRGLPGTETLILIDGHRAAGAAIGGRPNQPDVNGVPLALIERIEVLASSASGIYGGNATGGVINIILKRNFTGGEVRFTYENTFETDAGYFRGDFAVGRTMATNTRILVTGSYSQRNLLLREDREVDRKRTELLLRNVPASLYSPGSPPLGATTNISSVPVFNPATGANVAPNLTLKSTGASLNSPITFVPYGYGGGDGGAAFLANAGRYNLDLARTPDAGLAPFSYAPETKSVNLTARHDFPHGIHAFIEAGYQENEFSTSIPLQTSFLGTFQIPSAAAVNPFNQDIIVRTPLFVDNIDAVIRSRSTRLVGGFTVDLPASWQGGIDYTFSQVTSEGQSGPNQLDALQAGNAITSGSINVFRDTNRFPVSFSGFLVPNASFNYSPVTSALSDLNLRAGGPVVHLPMGEIVASTQLAARRETIEDYHTYQNGTTFFIPEQWQDNLSFYLEMRIPLLKKTTQRPWFQYAELQAAGRADWYKTDGASRATALPLTGTIARATNRVSSVNPSAGIVLDVASFLRARANYSTGFLPPRVDQLVSGQPSVLQSFRRFVDPRRNNEAIVPSTVTTINGGNPDLKPEESQTWSAGLILTAKAKARFRMSVDWVHIDKTDTIQSLVLSQNTVNLEQFIPGVITRGAAAPGDPLGIGKITRIDTRLRNFQSAETEAVDFALDVDEIKALGGDLGLTLAATRMIHSRLQVTPNVVPQEWAGYQGNLEWRANATVHWKKGPYSASWTATYFDGQWVNLDHSFSTNQGSATLPSQVVHDVMFAYRFQRIGSPSGGLGRLLAGTEIQLGVKNIFNREPIVSIDLDPFVDPSGATYYLSVKREF